MKDDRYDMDEVERMLSPRCEFRASDVLRPEIMKRARALQEPRRFRLAPWLAAACVAGVVVVSLMRSEQSAEDVAESPCVAEVVADTPVRDEAADAPAEDVLVAEVITPAVKPAVEKAAQAAVTDPAVVHDPAVEPQVVAQVVERPSVGGPMPMGSGEGGPAMPRILAETDIPVTRPENLEYTYEELSLMKRQALMAYLSRIRLEIEIAEQSIAESKI